MYNKMESTYTIGYRYTSIPIFRIITKANIVNEMICLISFSSNVNNKRNIS